MPLLDKAPQKVIIDADDTNANTYGAQQLTLFNAYYNEYCYMLLQMFDGMTGKLTWLQSHTTIWSFTMLWSN